MIRGFVSKLLGKGIVYLILIFVILFLILLAVCWMIPGSPPCTILKIFGLDAWIPI